MKIAVFCPRLGDEPQESWKRRWRACRRLAMKHTRAACVDLFDLYDLQVFHVKTPLRKIIVARQGFYPLEFQDWVRRKRIEVLDSMAVDLTEPVWLREMQR